MQGRISVILYLALLYVLKSKPKENNLTNILDAEPDHIQQPKLQNHVVEITRVIHRLLILEPDNPGAISLHNDFLDTLHNRFYGHEGWQSEWHKPRHAHLLHGQGFQDDDVPGQNDDNGWDEDGNKESDDEYEEGHQQDCDEGHHQAYDDDGQQGQGNHEHQGWSGHQHHGDGGHQDWDENQGSQDDGHHERQDWDTVLNELHL